MFVLPNPSGRNANFSYAEMLAAYRHRIEILNSELVRLLIPNCKLLIVVTLRAALMEGFMASLKSSTRRRPTQLAWIVVAVVLSALPLSAALSNATRPEDVGLSSERLQRINQMVQRYIDAKEITGAVTIVSRKGKIAHFEAQGLMDVENKTPMRKDAIFRMASMSKPVTGVAILMLVEEGKIRLTDPVSRFIPGFKNLQVAMPKPTTPGAGGGGRGRGRGGEAPEPEIYSVPALREITVRDLLTHTSGLESSGIGNRAAARAAPRLKTDTLATYVPQLAAGPLDFQPGTIWSTACSREWKHLDGLSRSPPARRSTSSSSSGCSIRSA